MTHLRRRISDRVYEHGLYPRQERASRKAQGHHGWPTQHKALMWCCDEKCWCSSWGREELHILHCWDRHRSAPVIRVPTFKRGHEKSRLEGWVTKLIHGLEKLSCCKRFELYWVYWQKLCHPSTNQSGTNFFYPVRHTGSQGLGAEAQQAQTSFGSGLGISQRCSED